MNDAAVMEVARQGMTVGLMVTLPVLAVALFFGLLVSVFQAVTQNQEMTLTYLPKLIGAAIVVALMGSWILKTMVGFTHLCFDMATRVAAG